MATIQCELTENFTSEETAHHTKISIMGTGSVGMACAVSFLSKDWINEEVFLSIPCMPGENGIADLLKIKLTAEEETRSKKSTEKPWEIQKELKL
uniref:Lactate/malate dehydrogenase N-terminal domain-containing protein n=2 Tax=Equus TaxID=9789 RepID=A0A3Q2L1Q6_HORSE